jgi:hypothetical protein
MLIKDSMFKRGIYFFGTRIISQIRKIFKDGLSCGLISNSHIIIQKIVKEPVLHGHRKIDLRYYIVVKSSFPLIYEVVPGFGRVAASTYNPFRCTVGL